MIYDSLKHNEKVTPNSLELNTLRENFPQYFDKDGQFMLDRFSEMLRTNEMQITKEGYELKFLGKSYAKYQAGLETETVIVPDLEHNSKPENKDSENLYIVGDNLDALQHLVKSYTGQVKCIYIDPPYNTGSDGFVYQDDFGFTVEQLVKKIGMDEEEARRILDMQGKSSHSAWLTFMYPRLILARELLSDDGVIFTSIDYNENYNLREMLNEVFGEINFVGEIYWESKTKSQNTVDSYSKLQPKAEMIFVYKKRDKNRFNLIVKGEKDYPESDHKGCYREYPIEVMNADGVRGRKTMIFPINDGVSTVYPPEGKQWQLGQDQVATYFQDGDLFIRDGKAIIKMRPEYERAEKTDPFWGFFPKEIGTAESAKKELNSQLPGCGFDTVKPVEMIKRLIFHSTDADSLILDFFSGSATTAQAVMQLNAEDGGNRGYIMVQWPEKIEEKKPAYQAGYRTIDEIGRERIKRAAAKIKEETGADIDYGYKLVRLLTPTEKTLDELSSFDPLAPIIFTEDYVEKFAFANVSGHEVILSTWLNQDGFGLLVKPEKIQLASYMMDLVADSGYIIEKDLSSEDVQQLVLQIERGVLKINRIVVYPYSVPFAVMHELKQNLSVLKSGQKVEIIERF